MLVHDVYSNSAFVLSVKCYPFIDSVKFSHKIMSALVLIAVLFSTKLE